MSPTKEQARALFRSRVQAALDRADQAFQGQYADEIAGLLALSEADIRAVSPSPTALVDYNKLISVVKEASRVNVAQAELKQKIQGLGNVAIGIARRVPRLGAMLV